MSGQEEASRAIEEFFLFLEGYFESLLVDILKTIVYELYPKFEDAYGKQREHIFGLFRDRLNTLADIVGTEDSPTNILREDQLRDLSRFPLFTIDEFKIRRIRIDGTRLDSYEGSRILRAMGVLSPLGKKITLDYPFFVEGVKDEKGKPLPPVRVPATLSEALCNLAAFFRSEQLKSKWLAYVAERNGISQDAEFSSQRMDQSEAGLQVVYQCVNAMAGHLGRLKDSKTFYNNLGRFYNEEGGAVHVYSTTSGLIVPTEHFGSDRAGKDTYRLAYFETLRNTAVPTYYQLDPQTTFAKLPREDEEKAVEIFSSFLVQPNIEVSTAPFGEHSWKKLFTLSSPALGVACSTREEQKKIHHGVYGNVWKGVEEVAESPFTKIHRLYEQEKAEGLCEVIKELGERLSPEEADERARLSIKKWRARLK